MNSGQPLAWTGGARHFTGQARWCAAGRIVAGSHPDCPAITAPAPVAACVRGCTRGHPGSLVETRTSVVAFALRQAAPTSAATTRSSASIIQGTKSRSGLEFSEIPESAAGTWQRLVCGIGSRHTGFGKNIGVGIMRPSQRIIAVAEDDQDDRVLTRDAFGESRLNPELVFFGDGEALMGYLHASIAGGPAADPLPSMILLDLNMPKVDGREALAAIRSDLRLRHLPVIVISTSRSDQDVIDLYQRGANAFIRKPSSFDQLVQALNALEQFWFRTANLPVIDVRPR